MAVWRGTTRIESRTLLLFVASALLPVIAFAALGYIVVSGELQKLAQRELDSAAKSYGLAIFDRLQQMDQRLSRIALRYLQGEIDAASAVAFQDDRGSIRVLTAARSPGPHVDATTTITRELTTVPRDGNRHVILEVRAHDVSGSIHLQADLKPEYLWNADAILPAESTVCVLAADATVLDCGTGSGDTDGEQAGRSLDDGDLHGDWTLFLGATFAVPQWQIEIRQSRAAAFRALDAFRWVLPLSAALATAIALLIGSVFIRRSHAPLRSLTQAARRIARRDFGQPIRIESRDEYGRLARTFNRMAGNLRDQFALLASLTRVDEVILSHGGAQEAVKSLLPQMPRLIGSRIAGILLFNGSGSAELSFVVHESDAVHRLALDGSQLESAGLHGAGPHRRVHGDPGLRQLFAALKSFTVSGVVFAPIVVRQAVRGHILVSDENYGRSAREKLQGIAHRIAVAIGNDDHEQELWHEAHYDSLTGLANRSLLRQKLAAALKESAADGHTGALLFIDLDRFKSVNDSLGHSIGDQLLCQVAARLTAQAPSDATVSRFGGDEFAVLLPRTTPDDALACATQLLVSLRDPCHLQELRYVTQASAGIALFPAQGATIDALLMNADIAMYRAKAGGRARVSVYDDTMSEEARERPRLEERLRAAIHDAQIRAYFQPKVDATGKLVAAEALARWKTQDGVSIPPLVFIALAEETGLIVPLGESLLRESCQQMRQWRDQGIEIGHVAVNISMVQMRDPAFASFVLGCLAECELPAHCLELELTESLLADDSAAITQQLLQLSRAGVRIAIDDFGTGFSSMSRLRDYPINTLKIDRSFVRDCGTSREARLLLKALIDVGHALNLEVVAEGVEDPSQLDVLRTLGCNLMQGFLFAHAMSAGEFATFVAQASIQPQRLTG
ncbi:MAG TPA: EAL domain-containing protein [Povalibacter sp.]